MVDWVTLRKTIEKNRKNTGKTRKTLRIVWNISDSSKYVKMTLSVTFCKPNFDSYYDMQLCTRSNLKATVSH